jgi:hypothetical protein
MIIVYYARITYFSEFLIIKITLLWIFWKFGSFFFPALAAGIKFKGSKYSMYSKQEHF